MKRWLRAKPLALWQPGLAGLLGLVGALTGCETHGVSLGREEPCAAEPLLIAPDLYGAEERLSPCARLGANLLDNGGFELPVVGSCGDDFFCQFPAAEVAPWSTDSSASVIEIWNDGHRGVAAADGAQFVELDAQTQDTLWQDVSLMPGQLVYWSLLHRGRIEVESMELQLGPPAAPVTQAVLSSATDAWYPYSGLYRVGASELTTRIALASRSGVAEGNLVDAVLLAPVLDEAP